MKKAKFWRSLEALPDGAVLAEWALELGPEFERARRFLQPTTEAVASYPCPSRPRCECRQHRIERVRNEERVAVCDCGQCAPLRLKRADLTVHELNRPHLAEALAGLCGWQCCPTDGIAPEIWRLGRWPDLRANIYWGGGGRADRVRRMVDALFAFDSSPFILALPTRANLTPSLDAALKREGCGALPLEEHFAIGANGELLLEQSIAGIREEFAERAASRRDTAKVLREIQENLHRADGAGAGKERERPLGRHAMHHAGKTCRVVFAGSPEFLLNKTLGTEYVDYLLHHPNDPISAYDLEMKIRPDKIAARPKDSIQKNLDPETIREYLRRLDKLRDQRDEAAEDGNDSKVDLLDEEIDALETEVNKNVSASDSGERARGNVGKAISALKKILSKGEPCEKAFGLHIEQLVNTGYECLYNQPLGNIWE